MVRRALHGSTGHWANGGKSDKTMNTSPAAPATYRNLDAEKVIRTIERLNARIFERFPGGGLSAVCGELLALAQRCSEDAARIAQPNWWLRALITLGFAGTITAFIAIPILLWGTADADSVAGKYEPLTAVQGLEAAFNIVALTWFGLMFLSSIEDRAKRRQAFKSLHQLRSITHVIDMHQLTKDPSIVAGLMPPTPSSPKRDMTPGQLLRYLDYCTEMLSLTGKVAALYAQNSRDHMIINAANEIEELTTSLSRKIWQKLIILQHYAPEDTAAPVPTEPNPLLPSREAE